MLKLLAGPAAEPRAQGARHGAAALVRTVRSRRNAILSGMEHMANFPPSRSVTSATAGRCATPSPQRAQARALRDDCLSWLPPGRGTWCPALDGMTRRWLRALALALSGRDRGDRRDARLSRASGSSTARTNGAAPRMRATRTARRGCCARSTGRSRGLAAISRSPAWRGAAGDYYSATWPGFVGVLTAMAPGRFSAAINQAPLWRRTRHPWLRLYDVAANAIATWSLRHIPPDQLLRQAMETCATFAQARALLESTPIARPVIYTLAGCAPGERCVIERTEEGFDPHREHRRGERLARAGRAVGGARRRRPAVQLRLSRRARQQPRPARGARRLERAGRAGQLRLGGAAGVQSVHPASPPRCAPRRESCA